MKKNETPKPFFAKYLENQDALQVKTSIKAGRPAQTLKYPSDNDEIAEA